MGQHRAISKEKLAGGVLLGAVVSGLAAVAVSAAGSANATCASISGIGNSANCQSSLGAFAVGLGSNTFASSNGLFSGAVANGLTNTGAQFTVASSTGNLDFAYAEGPNTIARSTGNLALAVAIGSGVSAFAGNTPSDLGNLAVNFAADDPNGNPLNNQVFTNGAGNAAFNLNGTRSLTRPAFVQAVGVGNLATNVSFAGLSNSGNQVSAGSVAAPSTLTSAFNVLGTNNTATTSGGPFAVAGTLGGSGKIALQSGLGFTIK
jgi:hypothetical protein